MAFPNVSGMSRVLLLLVPRAAAHVLLAPPVGQFIGRTYTARQVLEATATFWDCKFFRCRTTGTSPPGDRGGALYLNNEAYSVGFIGCLFEECKAANRGGAMRIDNSLSFSMTGSTGLQCSSDYRYGFFCAYIDSTLGSFTVAETASVSCTSPESTIKLRCLAYWSDGVTSVESLNSTANDASSFASGFYIEQHFTLSLHFCVFSQNRAANCLFFSEGILNNDISCLVLFNNFCRLDSDSRVHPGLICLSSAITFSSCVFQSNTFDYFVAAEAQYAGTAVFVNCVSDIQLFRSTNSIVVSTIGCVLNRNPTLLAECKTRTPMPSRTATISRTPSPLAHSRKVGIIVAVVLPVVVVAVVVVVVLVVCKGRTEAAVLEPLAEEWIH
jgi:hypothetical protein